MKRGTALLVAVASSLGISAIPADAQAQSNIGVVNLARVFAEYQMTRDLEMKFEQERRSMMSDAEQRRSVMNEKRQGLAPFKPGSQAYVDRSDELTRLEVEYEVWLSINERQLKREHKHSLVRIYDRVRSVVKEMADSRQIDVVLTYDEIDDSAPDSNAMRQQILLQKVLYAQDRVDLTESVLQRLNEQYGQQIGQTGGGTLPVIAEDR